MEYTILYLCALFCGGVGDGDKIREELKRVVPEYQAQSAESRAHSGEGK